MKPEEGAKKQIEINRRMPGKDRLRIAFEMWEIAVSQMRASERGLNPGLGEKEIERRARRRMRDGAVRRY